MVAAKKYGFFNAIRKASFLEFKIHRQLSLIGKRF